MVLYYVAGMSRVLRAARQTGQRSTLGRAAMKKRLAQAQWQGLERGPRTSADSAEKKHADVAQTSGA
jgi:Arc/MetJ-type ribon-helix-helix transcriptional regulator